MGESKRWIEKVIEAFLEEVGAPPRERDEVKLQDKVLTLIQFRANGLDSRKMGLLAADIYRLTHSTRKRIIEDLARVAASRDRGGVGLARFKDKQKRDRYQRYELELDRCTQLFAHEDAAVGRNGRLNVAQIAADIMAERDEARAKLARLKGFS